MRDSSIMEKVTAYEMAMIKNYPEPDSAIDPYPESHDRYNPWNLGTILADLGLQEPHYEIIWSGFESNSHVYSLMFCLLKACLNEKKHKPDLFVKLKHSLYQLGIKTLTPARQKTLVEMLSFAQYTTDLSKFLGKYCALEQLFVLIFDKTLEDARPAPKSPMEQLKYFCGKLPFTFLNTTE